MIVFLNGKLIPENEAKVSVTDFSYQFGFGLYETIRCEKGIPLFFEGHYKRLTTSAKEIGMPFPVDMDEIRSWIIDTTKANKLSSARVKLIISKRMEGDSEKFNVLVMASPLSTPPQSYKLICKKLSRDTESISYRHKTTSRADSFMVHRDAIKDGYNDVLYLNDKNELVECSRANVYLVLQDKIITPILESGILSGVTRTKILDSIKNENITLEEKNVHSLYLNKATSVFITNAIIGVMPVDKVVLDGKEYSFSVDSITNRVISSYNLEMDQYLNKQPITKY